MIETTERPRPGPVRVVRDGGLASLVVAAAAGVAFFALAFGIRHVRVPWGDDTFFYVTAVRTAGRYGLVGTHLLARPGFPLLGATLASVLRTDPWVTAVGLPFAMAAGMGLAGAALAVRFGARGWIPGVFAALLTVSVVTTRLAAGKTENLMLLWFVAAAISVAAWNRSRRRTVTAAAFLLFVGGLAEWPFLAAFFLVVAAALGLWRLAHGRWTRPTRGASREPEDHDPRSDHPVPPGLDLLELLLACGLAAVALAVVIFGVDGTGPGDAVQRLPPTFRYALRLEGELRLVQPLPTGLAFVAGWWVARRRAQHGVEPVRFLLTLWAGLILLVILVGLTGLHFPTYRAITFGLPFALGLAAAPFLAPPRVGIGRWGRAAARTVITTVMVALVVVPSTQMWYRKLGPQTDPEEMGQIAAAWRYAGTLPPGSPAVLVVSPHDIVRGYFYQRLVVALAPPDRSVRLLLFAGRAADALAGRPTPFVSPSVDAVSRDLFEPVGPALAAGAPILVSLGLDPFGFRQAEAIGRPIIGNELAVLRGPPPPPAADGPVRPFVPLPAGWVLGLWSLGMLTVMTACGLGWSELATSRAPATVRAALAPAFGGGALALLALVVDRAGFAPGGALGPLIVTVAVLLSAAAFARSRTRAGRFRPRPAAV